jgi:hypothetical protein
MAAAGCCAVAVAVAASALAVVPDDACAKPMMHDDQSADVVVFFVCVPDPVVILYCADSDTFAVEPPPVVKFDRRATDTHDPFVVSESSLVVVFVSAPLMPTTRSPDVTDPDVTVPVPAAPDAVADDDVTTRLDTFRPVNVSYWPIFAVIDAENVSVRTPSVPEPVTRPVMIDVRTPPPDVAVCEFDVTCVVHVIVAVPECEPVTVGVEVPVLSNTTAATTTSSTLSVFGLLDEVRVVPAVLLFVLMSP